MPLGKFEKPEFNGDTFGPKSHVDKPLVVQVREMKHGLKTKYTTDAEGDSAVVVDVADLTDGSVYVDVQWFTAAVRDQLAPFVGETLPIKLTYQASQTGNSYIAPEALDDQWTQVAEQWVTANPGVFEARRTQKAAEAAQQQPAQPQQPVQQAPQAPASPPPQPPAAAPPAAPAQPPAAAPAPPPAAADTPQQPPAPQPPAAAPQQGAGAVDPNDPTIQALLAQVQQQQQQG